MMGLVLASPGGAWAARSADAGVKEGPARHAPRAVIAAPADGSTFRVGDPVSLHAEVSDPDGPLDPEAVAWTVVRHTGEQTETVAEGVGSDAKFTPSDRLGPDTTYEIRVVVTDPHGLACTASVTIVPQTVKLTLRSEPGGAPLALGSATSTTTLDVTEAVGRRLTLSAPQTYERDAGTLAFESWSDGGAREREYVVPETATELVARYAGPPAPAPEVVAPVPAGNAQVATAVARIAVGDGLRIQASLPVVSFDAPQPFAPRSLSGWLRGAPRGMRVEIALRRGGGRSGCGWWVARNSRFNATSRPSCGKPRWQRAVMRRTPAGWRWKVSLGGVLPTGRYSFVVRVLDGQGHPVDIERR